MLVQSLLLRDFRNLASVEITPDPHFNVFVGANGQGKTNLLESVFFMNALKSFRSLKNAALIRHGAEAARCSAWVDRGGVRREIAIDLRPRSRKITLNGNTVRKLADFFGLVNAVAFVPEDVSVLKASPSDRRKFLDRMIFNARPGYAAQMNDYETALKQRNALLRDGQIRDQRLLDVYDAQLVEHGAGIAEARYGFVEQLRPPFQESFAEIFGPGFEPHITYRMKFADDRPDHDELLADGGALRNAMAKEFKTAIRKDLARGYTTVGPHRDDLAATLMGQPMREFASQGQHRAFVLALKITEIRLLNELLGHYPVLLLDDVSSELDPVRNARLFDFLATIDGQVFITTTDVAYVRLSHPFRRWRVQNGEVSA